MTGMSTTLKQAAKAVTFGNVALTVDLAVRGAAISAVRKAVSPPVYPAVHSAVRSAVYGAVYGAVTEFLDLEIDSRPPVLTMKPSPRKA